MNEVKIKDIDFKLMPNDEEFYFCIDLSGGKRVHRGGHIKAHPNNFISILLCDEQTPITKKSEIGIEEFKLFVKNTYAGMTVFTINTVLDAFLKTEPAENAKTNSEVEIKFGTPEKELEPNSIVFHTTTNNPILKLCPNGDIFINGRLAENDKEVVEGMRLFLNGEPKRFIELCKKHKAIMETKNIIISVYTNASGFLWSICKVDSGTDLGWCNFHGNCEMSGAFKSYEDCLEDAVTLIEKCDLEKFEKEVLKSNFHWGNYSEHLNQNYRK